MSDFQSQAKLETAVYWAKSGFNVYGESSFDSPVEITVRWTDKNEEFISYTQKLELSRALVHVESDLTLGGYLYRGSEDELDSDHDDPMVVEGAHQIRAAKSTSSIDGKQVTKKVWLGLEAG